MRQLLEDRWKEPSVTGDSVGSEGVMLSGFFSARRASERTHLDREERDGGRPLLALPLGFTGTKARDPRVP